MKLTFLGTRGEIEKRTRRHRIHTSLMVSYRGVDVMIDCGLECVCRGRGMPLRLSEQTREAIQHWVETEKHSNLMLEWSS